MNERDLESRLVAAAPLGNDAPAFVKDTMQKITRTSPNRQLSAKATSKKWLHRFSKPSFALLVLVAATLIGGVVYAAVHFAPLFITTHSKETNPRGATEYKVSGFAECAQQNYSPTVERFEIKKDAPAMADEEVQKIIQAKCELKWLENFPKKVWTNTNPPSESWKDGDVITYTRLHTISTLVSATAHEVRVQTEHIGLQTYQPAHGAKIKAFASGEEVPLGTLKPGDAVFTIVRMSEPARNWPTTMKGKDGFNTTPNEQPKLVGMVGLFKLSLPLEYYHEKQRYVTEIPICIGNEQELCPNTPSIDVYPRQGGEGPINPHRKEFSDAVHRQISGTVTALSDDVATIAARSGATYTIKVGDAGFKVYNRDFTVRLQLEALNIKQGNVQQY